MGAPMRDDGQLEMFEGEDSVDDVIQRGPAETAEALRDEGMARAEDHCEEDDPGWTERAIRSVAAYCEGPGAVKIFTVQDVRTWAESYGFPKPASERGWGPVMMKAARRKIIVKNGVSVSDRPTHHKGFVTTWKPGENGV